MCQPSYGSRSPRLDAPYGSSSSTFCSRRNRVPHRRSRPVGLTDCEPSFFLQWQWARSLRRQRICRRCFVRHLANQYKIWWAARVSIPAPWESGRTLQWRPPSFKLPGQGPRRVHRRPPKSSRIWCPGYIIGYMNLVATPLGLCALTTSVVSQLNFGLRRDGVERHVRLPCRRFQQIVRWSRAFAW